MSKFLQTFAVLMCAFIVALVIDTISTSASADPGHDLNQWYKSDNWSCSSIVLGNPLYNVCVPCERANMDFFQDTNTTGHCVPRPGISSSTARRTYSVPTSVYAVPNNCGNSLGATVGGTLFGRSGALASSLGTLGGSLIDLDQCNKEQARQQQEQEEEQQRLLQQQQEDERQAGIADQQEAARQAELRRQEAEHEAAIAADDERRANTPDPFGGADGQVASNEPDPFAAAQAAEDPCPDQHHGSATAVGCWSEPPGETPSRWSGSSTELQDSFQNCLANGRSETDCKSDLIEQVEQKCEAEGHAAKQCRRLALNVAGAVAKHASGAAPQSPSPAEADASDPFAQAQESYATTPARSHKPTSVTSDPSVQTRDECVHGPPHGKWTRSPQGEMVCAPQIQPGER
ncbi:MAG TPA: hypothetical protein VII49_00940 [Rhizomicrobium sp.]